MLHSCTWRLSHTFSFEIGTVGKTRRSGNTGELLMLSDFSGTESQRRHTAHKWTPADVSGVCSVTHWFPERPPGGAQSAVAAYVTIIAPDSSCCCSLLPLSLSVWTLSQRIQSEVETGSQSREWTQRPAWSHSGSDQSECLYPFLSAVPKEYLPPHD